MTRVLKCQVLGKIIPACVLTACFMLSACTRPEQTKEAGEEGPKREYRELKPEVFPIPKEISEALPGLLSDNFYLYRDISPTLNLVAYVPDYSLDAAIKMAAKAFMHMTGHPEFKQGIDFWIIQIQPEPDKGSQVFVWGVRPGEAEAYAASGDLMAFFRDSEYALIDDVIVQAGEDRMKHWPAGKGPEEPQGED